MRRPLFWLLLALGLVGVACSLLGEVSKGPGPTITQVTHRMQTVYYGAATCGTTSLPVEIALRDAALTPAQVGVQYRVVGDTAGPWRQVTASPAGNGLFLAVLAPSEQELGLLAGKPGRLEFRAYTLDDGGQWSAYPAQGTLQVALQPCQKSAAATGQDQAAPQVMHVFTSTMPVYAQKRCEPHDLTVTATVVDDSGQATVALEYWFEGWGQGTGAQQVRRLPMAAQGTVFQATIPVAQEASGFSGQGKSGQVRFRIVAVDPAGHETVYPPAGAPAMTVEVKPCPSGQGQANGASGSGGGASSGGGNRGPTALPPSGGSASQVTIQEVRTNPNEAYYGLCQSGETTWMEIEAVVSPIERVASARVHYRYDLSTLPQGQDFPETAEMYRAQGIGNYTAQIDVGQEVPDHAAIDQLVYYVEIVTTDGQKVTSGVQTFPLYPCVSSGSSGTGSGSGGSTPAIQDVSLAPDMLYFGFCDATQPTVLEVDAVISPASAVQQAQVYFGYVPQPNQIPNDSYHVTLNAQGGDRFAAGIDLNDWYGLDPPPAGFLAVSITVEDGSGGQVAAGPYYLPVQPCSITLYPMPTIDKFVSGSSQVLSGEAYTLEWATSDATCGVYLDGNAVDASGTMTLTAPPTDVETRVTHVLTAYGEPCDNPSSVDATVDVIVQPAPNERISNDEQLFLQGTYDLDWDGTPDFTFNGGDVFYFLDSLNGTYFLFPPGSPTLATCRDLFRNQGSLADSTVVLDDRVMGQSVCVQTGAGRVGYLTFIELSVDPYQHNDYLRFSLRSETP